ncbi:MAG: hypothetical protein ACE3L7_04235 [Candidatus Pristimantibacillus sp.]
MVPKSFWKLFDYLQAIDIALHSEDVSPSDGKEIYALDVRQLIIKAKQTIANLERFFET